MRAGRGKFSKYGIFTVQHVQGREIRSSPPVKNIRPNTTGLLHEYMGHDVSNMRGFDSYRLLTLSLAALMTRISSVVIEGAHTSAGAATLARTVPFWVRFRSPREPIAGPCRGCLLPSATNTAPSRHHLQAVLCDGWDVQTPPSWLLRPQTRELYGWS